MKRRTLTPYMIARTWQTVFRLCMWKAISKGDAPSAGAQARAVVRAQKLMDARRTRGGKGKG